MSGAPRRLPWRTLMQAGLGRLRLPPEVFWAMTPGEFAAALEAEAPPAAMGRSGLARLMALHPDRPREAAVAADGLREPDHDVTHHGDTP